MNLRGRKQKEIVVAGAILFFLIFLYGYQCGWNKVCGVGSVERIVRSGKEVALPQGSVYAEVVDTPQSRAKGLSGRASLADDEGMLFIFEHPGKYGFWMKDMLFPIDMIWISENGTVMHIERNVSPESYLQNPPKTFINKADAKYVLELAAGRAEKMGVYLGVKVNLGE